MVRVRTLQVQYVFLSPKRPDQFCCTPNLLSDGYRGTFPGVKRPGRDADYSPPTIAEVKSEWIYTSTPCLCYHGVYRENLNFYFYYIIRDKSITNTVTPNSLDTFSPFNCRMCRLSKDCDLQLQSTAADSTPCSLPALIRCSSFTAPSKRINSWTRRVTVFRPWSFTDLFWAENQVIYCSVKIPWKRLRPSLTIPHIICLFTTKNLLTAGENPTFGHDLNASRWSWTRSLRSTAGYLSSTAINPLRTNVSVYKYSVRTAQ